MFLEISYKPFIKRVFGLAGSDWLDHLSVRLKKSAADNLENMSFINDLLQMG